MNDKQKARLKKFGDKLAGDGDVMAHVITVWYRNGDTETNWSGLNTTRPIDSAPFLLEDDGDGD
jgi:hypothetical protein